MKIGRNQSKALTPFQMIGGMMKKGIQKMGAPLIEAMKKEEMMAKKKDEMQRANAPVGAYGGTNTGAVKFPSNVKIIKRK